MFTDSEICLESEIKRIKKNGNYSKNSEMNDMNKSNDFFSEKIGRTATIHFNSCDDAKRGEPKAIIFLESIGLKYWHKCCSGKGIMANEKE